MTAMFLCTHFYFLLFTQDPQTNLLINSQHPRDTSKISLVCTQNIVLEVGILTEGYFGFIFLMAN